MTDQAIAQLQQRRQEAVRQRLNDALEAKRIEIRDVTNRHKRHAQAQDGRAHFEIVVVSHQFDSLPTLRRHRLVYDALDELIKTDIHSLSIKALTPDQDDQQ